jgi:hypothetical protein
MCSLTQLRPRLTRLILAGAFLAATSSFADTPKVNVGSFPTATVAATKKYKQVSEYILTPQCIKALIPGLGFELHVGMNSDGSLDMSRVRAEGTTQVLLAPKDTPGCNVRINVTRVEEK